MTLLQAILKFVVKLLTIIFAVALALGILSTYIPPDKFEYISVFGLIIPFLIIINVIFLVVWLLSLKMFVLFPFLALLCAWGQIDHFANFDSEEIPVDSSAVRIKVMSYNVCAFWYGESAEKIVSGVEEMIARENPDVVCFQEYVPGRIDMSGWKHHYLVYRDRANRISQAIYSKYPITYKGTLSTNREDNNIIWCDLYVGKDREVRIYNMHMPSLRLDVSRINKIPGMIPEERTEEMMATLDKLDDGFVKQKSYAVKLRADMDDCPLPKIACGDMNNTAFSYTFRTIAGDDMTDAFAEKGKWFGRSFRLVKFYPLRIDFILCDGNFGVSSFTTLDEPYSDHNAIVSTLALNKE